MERDFGQEIDSLREEVEEIRRRLSDTERKKVPLAQSERMQRMPGMHPDERMNELMDDCVTACEESGDTGRITYLGVFASGGNQSNWIKKDLSADKLLDLAHPENGTARKVLACIGSQEKLSILAALLRHPLTVAQLLEECAFSSTGQVYHHLNPLLSYGFVEEDRHAKNRYCVPGNRVQGILMILAGIDDLTEPAG